MHVCKEGESIELQYSAVETLLPLIAQLAFLKYMPCVAIQHASLPLIANYSDLCSPMKPIMVLLIVQLLKL